MRTAASATLAVIGFVALGTLYIAQSGFEGKGMNLLQNDNEVDMRFINFIGKYQKSYQSKEEFLQRMEIFARTAQHVDDHN